MIKREPCKWLTTREGVAPPYKRGVVIATRNKCHPLQLSLPIKGALLPPPLSGSTTFPSPISPNHISLSIKGHTNCAPLEEMLLSPLPLVAIIDCCLSQPVDEDMLPLHQHQQSMEATTIHRRTMQWISSPKRYSMVK